VSQEQTARIAQQLLANIGSGADPDEIAALFSADVQFEVPGDVGALPWIGPLRKHRVAGVTSQNLRYVDLLLASPWKVELSRANGFPFEDPKQIQIAHPTRGSWRTSASSHALPAR